ncbi:MAG TPA: hypothetical protein VMW09_08995 [Desulfatiglandales bacterium]|nr:hypothetical protein [Desulfatiglandales bacterium]
MKMLIKVIKLDLHLHASILTQSCGMGDSRVILETLGMEEIIPTPYPYCLL